MRLGSETEKVVPLPSVLSKLIEPPWLSMLAFAIVSPRPVPGTWLALAVVLRKKRWNSRSCSNAGMP
jgi:hypothetical protein